MKENEKNVEVEAQSGNNAVDDWVQMAVNAQYVKFSGTGDDRKATEVVIVPASMKASVDNNIISISDREHDIMLAVSLDEMAAIMAGVFDYHRKVEKGCKTEVSECAPDAGDR